MAQKVVKRSGRNRFWEAEDYEAFITDFLTDGIVDLSGDGSDMQVSEQSPQAMGIDVAIGRAYMNVTVSGMNYKERLENLATEQLSVNANATGDVRVDAVIARIDVDVDPSSTALNMGTVEVILGTGTSALSDSYIQSQIGSDSFIRLSDIAVPNSASSIIDSYITDQRSRCTLSGFNTVYADNILPIASGVNVNGFEFMDDAFEVTERGANPSTPTANKWKTFFKSDGQYIIKDDGTVTKIQTGGISTVAKAESAAADGEMFENTDDADVLAWKDSGSVVHNVVLADMISAESGTGNASDNNPAGTGAFSNSGDIDIPIGSFSLGDKLLLKSSINVTSHSNDTGGVGNRYSVSSSIFDGLLGDDGLKFESSNINQTSSTAVDLFLPSTGLQGNVGVLGNIQASSSSSTSSSVFTVMPPTISGNNLRFHWTHTGNAPVGAGVLANGVATIKIAVIRISKKA